MKKIIKKSPLKLENDNSAKKSTESKQILKTSSGRNYGINSASSTNVVAKSASAGSKVSNAPAAEKAKRYKKPASAWKGTKAGLAAHNAKKRAEWDKQDAAAEAAKPAETPEADVATDNGNASEYNKIPVVQQAGNVTTDYRGAVRSGKFLTRAAAQAETRSVRQADRAAKYAAKGNEAKAKKLTAKSEMNATNAKSAKAMQSRLAEQNEQGKTGHSSFTTDAPITEGQANFAQRGMTEGSSNKSTSSTVTNAPTTPEPVKATETISSKPASIDDVKASAKAADAEMQKKYAKSDGATSRGAVEIDYEGLKKSGSAAKMIKSSVLKMFKPGSFSMGGFGSKSKK